MQEKISGQIVQKIINCNRIVMYVLNCVEFWTIIMDSKISLDYVIRRLR